MGTPSDETVIDARSIGKKYRISTGRKYITLRDRISELITSPFKKREVQGPKWIWALKEVSFTVKRGEVIGIIGRNGAGKTTLLKILSKITRPTEGHAEVYGRVGSLLEVGTGFHNELTGMENIYLNGAILGMSRSEMNRKLGEIIEFADLRDYIDTPVKRYSTGMQARLAFSIAAHLEPDVLFVDEVLAVGDIKFQKKCLDRMGDVSRSGRTVLFVSHQLNQIRSLCAKGMWIDNGSIREFGETVNVLSSFESAMLSSSHDEDMAGRDSAPARFLGWRIKHPYSGEPNILDKLEQTTLEFDLKVNTPVRHGHSSIDLTNSEGKLMFCWSVNDLAFDSGINKMRISVPMLPLAPGNYRWRLTLYEDGTLFDEWNGFPELVINIPNYQHHQLGWNGPVNIPMELDTTGPER